jgi:hypothetical protein
VVDFKKWRSEMNSALRPRLGSFMDVGIRKSLPLINADERGSEKQKLITDRH